MGKYDIKSITLYQARYQLKKHRKELREHNKFVAETKKEIKIVKEQLTKQQSLLNEQMKILELRDTQILMFLERLFLLMKDNVHGFNREDLRKWLNMLISQEHWNKIKKLKEEISQTHTEEETENMDLIREIIEKQA